MTTQLIIGEDPGDIVIETSAHFDPAVQAVTNDQGNVDSIEYLLEGAGDVTGPDPATTIAAFFALFNDVSGQELARRVRIVSGGVTYLDLKPSEQLVGPFVTLFRSEPAPGNAASRWSYNFQITCKGKGNAGEGDPISDLATSIAVTVVNGKTTRKIWKATAKGKTITDAVNKVKSFKPSETDVTEEIERIFQENRATGVWVWDARQNDKTITIQEKVRYIGGGTDFIVDPQAGPAAEPVLFLARRKGMIIEITGSVFGYKKNLTAPEAHFSPSATLKRVTERETEFDVEIEDAIRGVYRLDYMEVWLLVGPTLPGINHHGHDEIKFTDAPSDGKAAG